MRIDKIWIYRLAIPFSRVVTHSLHERSETEAIIVAIQDETGMRGYGEGTPRGYVTGESLAATVDACGSVASRMAGFSTSSADELGEFLRDLGSAHPSACNPSAWCALEVAILDLWTKNNRAPFWRFFAENPVHQSFTYSGVVPILPDQRQLLEVLELARLFNLSFLKLKIKDCDSGLEAVKATRDYLGTDIDLRVDANGALSVPETLRFIEMTRSHGISAMEQPVPKSDLEGMTEVTSRSAIPIIADESLCTMEDAIKLIEHKGCHGFNIRLSKCGGFQKSLELAQLARARGILIQIGSHVGETGILSAAGRHFASLTPGYTYLEGSFSRFVLKEDIVKDDISFGGGGKALPLGGPGLGLQVNDWILHKWGTLVRFHSV
ncbi:MAG: hypothetical protein GX443_11985 [Deltaproteobacteria bacterium]|nr:hypothetical protein [Deltaproteobacteria bacterium]